ncbi:MAG: sigma-54-dependent Fis family transcriptional regulator [Deltaproteobacteria bacterium]|nr:sigma-54-dependent Fis family transcriptional regulator [Deltaproteobacteria bacterium]
MPERNATILLVEDDAPQRKTLAGFLRKSGYSVLEAESAKVAKLTAADQEVDLLLTDLRLGGPDGIELLQSLKSNLPDLQALVLTAYGTVDDAVRAMKAGAYDFISKPVDLDRLEALVVKALERVQLARANRGLREMVKSSGVFDGLIGESQSMRAVKDLATKVAPSRASVLLLGESGTGKEVLARAIHRASKRLDKPFMVVNCAALPETLIESELFGHEKGAFTGATTAKKGRFELADGGTLFLDEIGDIPLPVQVKLLNVLQSASFERVGGTQTCKVDVRIIAATHRDLEKRIEQDMFRSDLYYRLNVVSIRLPQLCDRSADVPLLVDFFIHKHADLSALPVERVGDQVLERLTNWPFPGNVRELENWIERAVVLAEGTTLGREDFPSQLFEDVPKSPKEADPENLDQQVARLEISLIEGALQRNKGNQSAAARELGLTERAIRYKIKKYGI